MRGGETKRPIRRDRKGVFVVAGLVISNILENLSIQTGFPFGHYHYTGGPQIFLVPWFIGPAYLGIGSCAVAEPRGVAPSGTTRPVCLGYETRSTTSSSRTRKGLIAARAGPGGASGTGP